MLELNMSLLYEIINLIILCLLLKKFLIGPVTNIMEKRKALIADGLENAKNSQAQASELKSHYEDALNNARSESVRIVNDAKKRAQEEYEHIVGEAGIEASEVRKRADKEIETEKARAIQDLKSRIAEIALSASQKVVGETDRTAGDMILYEQFLKEAGESDDERLQ